MACTPNDQVVGALALMIGVCLAFGAYIGYVYAHARLAYALRERLLPPPDAV